MLSYRWIINCCIQQLLINVMTIIAVDIRCGIYVNRHSFAIPVRLMRTVSFTFVSAYSSITSRQATSETYANI